MKGLCPLVRKDNVRSGNLRYGDLNLLLIHVIDLLALHSSQSQFLDVKGWGKQHSLETEDEDIAESKGLSWSQQLHASSEERVCNSSMCAVSKYWSHFLPFLVACTSSLKHVFVCND